MSRHHLRALSGALGVVLLVGLSGCSPLPEESPVERGPALSDAPRQDVSVEAEGPSAGITPEQLVQGFLRAGVDAEDDYAVARQYLTSSASASWQPGQAVLVHDERSQTGVTQVAGGEVRVDLGEVGSVDSSGVLTEAPPGERTDLEFDVERVDGEWRISRLPAGQGTFLTRADFQRLYRPVALHWGSTVARELVPDTRWFRDGDGLASAIGRAQAEPPPQALEGAIRSGVPTGTRLESASLPVMDGVAAVRLSSPMATASGQQRDLAWAQFVESLREVPAVEAVSLSAGGQALDSGSSPSGDQISYAQAVGYSTVQTEVPLVLLHRRQSLTAADPRSADLASAPDPAALDVPPIPASWERLAASEDLRIVAGVDGRQLGVWREGALVAQHTLDGELSAPSFDPLGFLWTTQQTESGHQVVVTDASSSPHQDIHPEVLDAPWADDHGEVTQVRVAPDGVRALVVLRQDGADRVAVVGIVRSADGEPTALTRPTTVVTAASAVRDLAWIDASSVVVLGEPGPEGEQTVWRSDLGGWTEEQGTVDNAVAVAAYPDDREDGILVSTEGGRVLTRAGSSWFVATAASDVVVPGR